MIVTTCGAAGGFGAFGGDGAGVCALATALTNNTTKIIRLKFIVVMLTNHASGRTDSHLARFVVNQN